MGDFWVFGYGSLIWNPGFEFTRESQAKLFGYHRRLCISSWNYRGTKERSGLVLGLDRGGSCAGVARLVSQSRRESVIDYLRSREMINQVYKEVWVKIKLLDGSNVEALTYVADSAHEQYVSTLPDEETVTRVKRAHGDAGPNIDYVTNTVSSLLALGIRDKSLEKIVAKLVD